MLGSNPAQDPIRCLVLVAAADPVGMGEVGEVELRLAGVVAVTGHEHTVGLFEQHGQREVGGGEGRFLGGVVDQTGVEVSGLQLLDDVGGLGLDDLDLHAHQRSQPTDGARQQL
jgi:hypothetical protein